MNRLLVVLTALALAAGPTRAAACSLCACGDPLLTATDPAAIGGKLRLQLDAEYTRMTAGNEADPTATDELRQWSARFNLVYRPVEPLTLSLTVPVVNKVMDMTGPGMKMRMSDQTGLGDMELAARWALWTGVDFGARRAQELALSAGTSLPTGPYKDKDAAGDLIDPHGQVGTGGWGPFLGAHYRLEQGDWSAFASFSGRLRTESSLGYKVGNATLWSAHGQWLAVRWLALDIGIDGRWAARDRQDGATVDNTGGTVLTLAPGAFARLGGGVWFFLRGQIPFYRNLYGEQTVGATVVSGLQYQAF